MRTITRVVLLIVSVLCCQCSFKWGWGDGTSFEDRSTSGDSSASSGTSASGGGTVSPLPEPDTWYVPPPELTPEQQVRKQEVDQYFAVRYSDYDILAATQGYSGDIYYWANSNTIPFANWSPPPGTWTAEDLIASVGAELAQTELDLYSALRGPFGSTPIHRPDFWNYILGDTSATSLQDYLENYQVSGMPAGQNRLYAGLSNAVVNARGISGTINEFQGDVEPDTFSLIELAVSCPAYGPVVEQIGVVVSRDRVNDRRYFPDAQPRLHIEYFTQGGGAGYAAPGKGSWDEIFPDFVPQPLRRYVPGQVVPASVLGGTQVEHRIDIFQAPNGDWWIAYQGDLLGYYPAHLFKMLNAGACRVSWYGEVFDLTPANWTWTPMGSGQFASAGQPNVSYVKNPRYYNDVYFPSFPVDDPNNIITYGLTPYVPACYTRSPLLTGTGSWYCWIDLGGPGGSAGGCN